MSKTTLPRLWRHSAAESSIPAASVAVVERPRGVAPSPLPHLPLGAPARSVGVLAELRADDRPVPPTAIRHAFDRGSWLPSVPLRVVPLRTLDDVATDTHATVTAAHDVLGDLATIAMDLEATAGALTRHPEAYPAHVLRMAFAPLVAMLGEVTL